MTLLDDRQNQLLASINALLIDSPELWDLVQALAITRLANGSVGGSGGGGGVGITEYNEDTPHVSGALGNLGLVVRRDANSSLVSNDGDYAPLQVDNLGNLKVNVVTGGTGDGATETTLTALNGKVPSLGQAAMAASTPVVIASNQSDVPMQSSQLPGTLGQKIMANSLAIAIASDQSSLPVTGTAYRASATITRPANVTAYAAGDVVGGVFELASIGANAQHLIITSLNLMLNISAVPSGMHFTLHLYSVTPLSAIADNAVWDLTSGDRASYLGDIGIGAPNDYGSTCFISVDSISKHLRLSGTSLFGYLVTNAAFTPAANSEVYTLTLHSVGA